MDLDFGERTKEKVNGAELPVALLPKYKESKEKAIELIEKGGYGLQESDFWILKNLAKNKDKMLYSGLIISHNGCLKINDKLGPADQYDAGAASRPQWDEKGNLIMFYQSERQGIYEVGEVSKDNCKNEYPYAMVVKRLFDSVVLKSSKIAFSGIYAEDEADDFRRSDEDAIEAAKKADAVPQKAEEKKAEPKRATTQQLTIGQQPVTKTNVDALNMLIDEVKADRGQLLSFYDISDLSEMNQIQWKQCMDILTRRKENGGKK